MRPRVFLAVFISVFALSLCTYAQTRKAMLVSDADLKLSYVESPDIEANNVEIETLDTSKKWLQLSVSYVLPLKPLKGGGRNQTEWLDGMSARFELAYPINYNGKKTFAHITGEVTYWAVPLNGKKHSAVAFIPPQILRRYARADAKLKKSELKDMFAKVTFFDKSRRVIGGAYHYPRKSSAMKAASYFAAMEKSLGILKLDGMILSRDKTPWRSLRWTNYEFIDPEVKK